jgi:hypothetical protein
MSSLHEHLTREEQRAATRDVEPAPAEAAPASPGSASSEAAVPGRMRSKGVLARRRKVKILSVLANVILRREDDAATRNMANTAKVIAENPVLMRLKELETMKDIIEKIDEIKLVMGLDDMKGFLPLANGKAEN